MRLVALLTDFGLDDPYVGEVKAQLLRLGPPELRLLDLSHGVPPGDIAAGAHLLARCWPQLPAGAVLLAVVDPGVGGPRPAVAAAADGRFFVGPGNGLAAVLGGDPSLQVVLLERTEPPPGFAPAATFAGRDLFAPAAARLAGGAALVDLGPAVAADRLGATAAPGGTGTVVWIDRFGNLVTDVRRDSELGRRLVAGQALAIGGRPVRGPVRAYFEATAGELVWYWGSGGTLEIAARQTSAASLLAARTGLALTLEIP